MEHDETDFSPRTRIGKDHTTTTPGYPQLTASRCTYENSLAIMPSLSPRLLLLGNPPSATSLRVPPMDYLSSLLPSLLDWNSNRVVNRGIDPRKPRTLTSNFEGFRGRG